MPKTGGEMTRSAVRNKTFGPPQLKHNAPLSQILHDRQEAICYKHMTGNWWESAMRALMMGAVLVLAASPAIADPREDMLAGISRCASLPDDRTFLDCAYGAAEPIARETGPSARAPLPDPSGAAGALPHSAPPPVASAVPSAPSAQMASVPPPQKSNNGVFGNLFSNGTEETLPMSAYSFDKRGLFTVTLSNGQVWRQRVNDKTFASWGAKASGYYTTVRVNSTGGYLLSVRGDDGLYRVDPVR